MVLGRGHRGCKMRDGPLPQGFALARWDDAFTDALLRLMQLGDSPADTAVLGEARLRELYYAVLKGDAGDSARRAFGVGNEIARAIEYLSSRLDEAVTIEELATQVGMSRAVFHHKFKPATTMSPILVCEVYAAEQRRHEDCWRNECERSGYGRGLCEFLSIQPRVQTHVRAVSQRVERFQATTRGNAPTDGPLF